MKIDSVGYNYIHDKDFVINRPFGTKNWMIILIRSSGIFCFNNEKVICKPNSFFICKSNIPQYYYANNSRFINDWFHFTPNENDIKYFEELKIPIGEIIHIGELEELSGIIKSMSREFALKSSITDDCLNMYAKMLFLKISLRLKENYAKKTTAFDEKLNNLRSDICSRPYEEWNIREIAKHLVISESYLQHLYKEVFGISIINDVINNRIEYAKYFLLSTEMPISRIAEVSGYKSEYHFMRQFKNVTTYTPREYRNIKMKKS